MPLPINQYLHATGIEEGVGLDEVPEAAPLNPADSTPPVSEMTDMNAPESEDEVKADPTEVDSPIIEEVEDLREPSVKHFRKDDGTVVAEIYPYAVHYDPSKVEEEAADPAVAAQAAALAVEEKEEVAVPDDTVLTPDDKAPVTVHEEFVTLPDEESGLTYEETEKKPALKEINNTLIDGDDAEIKEGVLTNTDNALNVSFAKNASDEKLLKVKNGKYGFSFRLFEEGFVSKDLLDTYMKKEEDATKVVNPVAETEAELKAEEAKIEALAVEIEDLTKAIEAITEAPEEEPAKVEKELALVEKEKEKGVVEEKVRTLRTTMTLKIDEQKENEEKEKAEKVEKEKSDVKKEVKVKKKDRKEPLPSGAGEDTAKATPFSFFSNNEEDEQTTIKKENEEKVLFKDGEDGVIYEDVKDGMDLEYILKGDTLKENIILKKLPEDATLSFVVNTENLTMNKDELGNIEMKDMETGELQYTIPAPFMVDEKQETSTNIALEFESKGENEAVITYSPDRGWLEDASRSYPVVIDPPFITDQSDVNAIADTFVSSVDPEDKWLNMLLYTGKNNDNLGQWRSFIKLPLPTLKSGDQIVKAKLNMHTLGEQTTGGMVTAHLVTGTSLASLQGTTWSNQPAVDWTVLDQISIANKENSRKAFDITNAVRSWYTTTNTGICLAQENQGNGKYVAFLSSDVGDAYAGARPYSAIQYINMTGIESNQAYHTQDAGRAGTGYLNDYTGDLAVQKPIMSEVGELYPLNVVAYYNGNYKARDRGVGYGWNLNINQYVNWRAGSQFDDGKKRLMYEDADGTQHYYKDDGKGVYKDEDSESESQITIGIYERYTFEFKDKDNNHLWFNTRGQLTKMGDKNGNWVEFNRDVNEKVYSAYSSNALTTKFVWNYDKATNTYTDIAYIEDTSGKRYNFEYTRIAGNGVYLTTITDADGEYGRYWYDTGIRNMYKLAGSTGKCFNYTYNKGSAKRVSKVDEYASNGGEKGGSLTMDYSHNATTYTDHKGRKALTQFNNLGQAISVQDYEGNAMHYKYGTIADKSALTSVSNVQKTVINKVKNHNFEKNLYWVFSNGFEGSTGKGNYATSDKHLGSRSFVIEKTNDVDRSTLSQWLELEKGKSYTFSGYVKTKDVLGKVDLRAVYSDGKNVLGKVEASEPVTGSTDWSRYQVSFEIPKDAVSNKVLIEASVWDNKGIAYFDNFQVEEGVGANRYNLIENGELKDGLEPFYKAGDVVQAISKHGREGRNAYNLYSAMDRYGALRQDVYVTGKKGEPLVLAGWGKAKSLSLLEDAKRVNRSFSLQACVYYTDGTTEWFTQKFNEGTKDWQYLAGVVVPKKDYRAVLVQAAYSDNAHYVDFADLQLYKEEFGQSYTYDKDGNPISVKDHQNNEAKFKFDDNSNLVGFTDPKGRNFKYEYSKDGKNNLLKATNSNGTEYTYDYTPTGRPTKEEIKKDDLKISSSRTYEDRGNFTKSIKDSSGNEVNNIWDKKQGLLIAKTGTLDAKTSYKYDGSKRIVESDSKINETTNVVNKHIFVKDNLTEIISGSGSSYTFAYNSWGEKISSDINGRNLSTNTYDSASHNMLSSTYGNGTKIDFVYDNKDRKVGKKYDGDMAYEYKYATNGELIKIKDNVNNVTTDIEYDFIGRIGKQKHSDGNWWKYNYTDFDEIKGINKNIYGNYFDVLIDYDKDSLVTDYKIIKDQKSDEQLHLNYEYDGLGRLTKEKLKIGEADFSSKEYSFRKGVESGTTTPLVEKESSLDGDIQYEYDVKGRIIKIIKGEEFLEYEYDVVGQLIKEFNSKTGISTAYAYDNGGNIVSKQEINSSGEINDIVYQYDEGWQECLVNYNGEAIEYDAIGNPLTLHDAKLTWSQGRRLASYNKGETEATYLYDENGIRKSKTINGIKTDYVTSQGEVIAQKTDDQVIQYLRDDKSQLIGMTVDDERYYYEKNVQGDIIAILDKDGKKVVEYSYDAYGNSLSVEGEAKDTIGKTNPFRYRSYFYDEESGFYYLQQRYYDSEIGRFINFDSLLGANQDELAYNVYAYCSNDPVNRIDSTGQWWSPFSMLKASFVAVKKVIQIILPQRNQNNLNGFNKQNAASWANNNYNKPPVNGSDANCTAFTSTAMLAGGRKLDKSWFSLYNISNMSLWGSANNQWGDLKYYYQITPTVVKKDNLKLDKVQPGDFIYFFNNDPVYGPPFAHHAAIVVKVTGDDIVYAAWSEEKNDGSIKGFLNNDSNYPDRRVEIFDLEK